MSRGLPVNAELEQEVAALRRENARLKNLLAMSRRDAEPSVGGQTAWFDRPPGTITDKSTPEDKLAFFATLIAARRDTYAIRWHNAKQTRYRWQPVMEGGRRQGIA